MRASAIAATLLLAVARLTFGQEDAHFSVLSATYAPKGDQGVISIVVRNEGEKAASGSLKVIREVTRCTETDPNYCREHPPAEGETCEAPCLRWETETLGTETAAVPTLASCAQATIEVRVPNREAFAMITVTPGRGLGFGLELKPR